MVKTIQEDRRQASDPQIENADLPALGGICRSEKRVPEQLSPQPGVQTEEYFFRALVSHKFDLLRDHACNRILNQCPKTSESNTALGQCIHLDSSPLPLQHVRSGSQSRQRGKRRACLDEISLHPGQHLPMLPQPAQEGSPTPSLDSTQEFSHLRPKTSETFYHLKLWPCCRLHGVRLSGLQMTRNALCHLLNTLIHSPALKTFVFSTGKWKH